MVGIYSIKNVITNERYIGQSINIERRWDQHRNNRFKSKYAAYPLYRSMNYWGIENFEFEVLEECSQYELDEKEQYYIQFYNTVNFGFNQIYNGETKKNRSRKILHGTKI